MAEGHRTGLQRNRPGEDGLRGVGGKCGHPRGLGSALFVSLGVAWAMYEKLRGGGCRNEQCAGRF